MPVFVEQLIQGEEGATMVEYALVVALIGAALVGVIRTLSSSMSGKFTTVSGTISGTSGS